MGTAASSARRHEHGAAAEERDEDAFGGGGLASSLDQVWTDGVPFTLLHDEAFVAEKYDEIQRSQGRRPLPSDDDAEDEALQMTGTDELPLEEVEQLTDLARIKLFTRHRALVDAAAAAKAGRGTSTTKDSLSRVAALEGASFLLTRTSRERISALRLRRQRSEVVRDYLCQLSSLLSRRRKIANGARDIESAVGFSHQPSREAAQRHGEVTASLSSVASLRIQLQMLRELRQAFPAMFDNVLQTLLQTLMEFPPFALQQTPLGSTDDFCIRDIELFCRDMLQPECKLSDSQRETVSMLLLVTGISCTRTSSLLKYCASALSNDSTSTNAYTREWVVKAHELMDAFRIDYKLGTLKNDAMLKQFSIRSVKREANREEDGQNEYSMCSSASDGSYIYVWNGATGMAKIGTGANFTITGRVYATCPAAVYFAELKSFRRFHACCYGIGVDVTAVLQAIIRDSYSSLSSTNVQGLFNLDGDATPSSSDRKLYVRFKHAASFESRVFWSNEMIGTLEAVKNGDSEVMFALFGLFDHFTDDAVNDLSQAASGPTPLQLTSEVLYGIAAQSAISELVIDEKKEVILVYSVEDTEQLMIERLALGDSVSIVEERSSEVYCSSITFCDGSLLLSLLHSQVDRAISVKNRRLLRVSVVDLKPSGWVNLHVPENGDQSINSRTSRPLFRYTSDGRQIFEIELCADSFRLRTYAPSRSPEESDRWVVCRSCTLNIKRVQCATFVSCFLKLLKLELRASQVDFALPSFFTNGCLICMLLPSITSALIPSDNTKQNEKYDCLMFNCETGECIPTEETSTFASRTQRVEAELLDVRSFERVLPGSTPCYDAWNNVVWVVNVEKNCVTAYRNPGRRLNLEAFNELGSPATTPKDFRAHSTVSRVLQFTYDVISVRRFAGTDKNEEKTGIETCFEDIENLLRITAIMASKSFHRDSSEVHRRCLYISMRLLDCLLKNAARPLCLQFSQELGSQFKDTLDVIIQGIQSTSNPDSTLIKMLRMAFSFVAFLTRLSHSNLNEQFDMALQYLDRWRGRGFSASDAVIAGQLLQQLRSEVEACEVSQLATDDVYNRLERLIILLSVQQIDQLHRNACTPQHAPAEGNVVFEMTALINCITQSILATAGSSPEVLVIGLRVFDTVQRAVSGIVQSALDALEKKTSPGAKDIEASLTGGLLHIVYPVVLSGGLLFIRNWDEIPSEIKSTEKEPNAETDGTDTATTRSSGVSDSLQSFVVQSTKSVAASLDALQRLSQEFGVTRDEDRLEAITLLTKTEKVESAHDYENNLDVTTELRIPGASRMLIQFDSRSRTEYNYDYVTFYKDSAQTQFYGEQYYSGRDGEHNWPGVEGNPPLVIDSDHCYVYFHTDASNTDWGFSFTATGEMFQRKSTVQRHWLSMVKDLAFSVVDEAIRLLVSGVKIIPIDDSEVANEHFLQSKLIGHGIASKPTQAADVVQLLRSFVNPPKGSPAESVVRALQSKEMPSRLRSKSLSGSFQDIALGGVNSAIRAVAAAILHHNMWGMDALALAQNLRGDISEQLLRGWKNAQKMRDWFHLGDAADAARQGPTSPRRRRNRSLRRQPSAYKGLSDEALQVLIDNVVERAEFLLELTPMSFSYVSGAKRRWGLLAKYGSAISSSTAANDSPLSKWYNLLDELQEATELRSLLHYRRSSCERMKRGQTKSVTEQVLEFVQSDVDVKELRRLMLVRSRRAELRARGFSLFSIAWSNASSGRLRCLLAETMSSSVRDVSIETTRASAKVVNPNQDVIPPTPLHFGVSISGCDESARLALNESFGACLKLIVSELQTKLDSPTQEAEEVLSMLKAVTLDYENDDSYFVQESRLLPQLLRSLASNNAQIRRAAQSLLEVLLNSFVVGRDSSDTTRDPNDISVLQRQLFATVSLQLEGVASLVRESADEDFTRGSRFYYLAGAGCGRVAAVSTDENLRWGHSILLWLNVPSKLATYALKVGDEVCRGPQWDDREEGSGSVVEIVDTRTVRVRWHSTKEEKTYTYSPEDGKMEVVLVDQGIGGVIFSKGTKTLVKDPNVAVPWNHFGLYLDDKRQLIYRISCGPDKECVYETNFELDCDDWVHVAIIQEDAVLKIYINGLLATQHMLDPFLVVRGAAHAGDSVIVESPHPVESATDQYWPIHFPGASSIRVTFDPLSEIDQTSGFVRFYRDARCDEMWGDDSYTGRYHDPERNFPGGQSHRQRSRRSMFASVAPQSSVVIPADRFLVYFQHNGSSSSWGFRLLATPEFSDGHESAKPALLNQYPFVFGEPSARCSDERAARCWVYQPETVNTIMTEEEVVNEMHATHPNSAGAPVPFPVDRALYVLRLLRTCAETSFGQSQIATPDNTGDLIFIAFEESVPAETRCAAVLVLKELWSTMSPEVIASQFERVFPSQRDDFVQFVFDHLARLSNAWENYAVNEDSDALADGSESSLNLSTLALRLSAFESFSLANEYASLLRRMAGHEWWLDCLVKLMMGALKDEDHLASNYSRSKLLAALILCGGVYKGISLGGRVKCCVSIDGKETIETGNVLRFRTRGEARYASVLFDCDPSRPVDVPVNDVAHYDDDHDSDVESFFERLIPKLGELVPQFIRILGKESSVPENTTLLKPKVSRKEVVEVVESEHPYAGGEDIRHPLVFCGASEIVIYFDKMSSIAGPNDYVSFLKRDDDGRNKLHPESSNGVQYWGEEKYFGDAFPGVGDNPPLRIPAAAVDVCFHADANIGVSRSEWGFKLTAHAYEETLLYPPERPPPISVGVINDLRARATKALSVLTRVLRRMDMSSVLLPAMAHVARIANQPCDGRPTQSTPKRQDFESKHPYSNSVMEYMVVTFSGASRLVISFDARSRTEFATDYLCFYKDKALADRWGEYQYSGCDDRANWPGTGGRPPLIIPSDSFTLLWCTDATNVDWGWKFTVVAEFPSVLPLELRIDQLEKRACDLWEIMYEGTEYQRDPPAHEYDGFERFDSLAEANGYRYQSDHLRKVTEMLSMRSKRPATHQGRPDLGLFRVLCDEGISVYQQPHDAAAIVDKLAKGEEFRAVKQSNGWLALAASEGSHGGWVRHRANDDLFVISTDYCARNEDLIVLGVDDVVSTLQNTTFVMDNSNPEHDAMTKFTSQFSFESLKGQLSRLQSLAYDTHRALTIKYAREVLLLYMTATTDAPLSLATFSSVQDFFMLLAHFQEQEMTIDGSLAPLDALEGRVTNLLQPPTDVGSAPGVSLTRIVDTCVTVLSKAQYLLPRTRGALRIIESMHPYLDDLDQYWQISIPGAKSIRIYFDPRSKTEAGCDWVCFYKDDSKRGETYGESQYSGRTGSENWPGCGGRPPLVIEASSVEAHFHSDSSQNDWGFKLYAVGIFDDADDTAPVVEQIRATVLVAKTSIWLLKLAAQAVEHGMNSPVFSADVLKALHHCLMHHPQLVKIRALELLGLLAQRHGFLQTVPIELVECIHHTLVSKLRAQALTEDRSDTKSEYFQALVQCAVLVDLAVDSNKFPLPLPDDTSMQNFTSVPLIPANEVSSSSVVGFIPILERTQSQHVELNIQKLSEDMDIILTQGSTQQPREILRWSSTGIVTVLGEDNMTSYSPYREGDLLTLLVDFSHQCIALRKNHLSACEITSQSHENLISWQTQVNEEAAWKIVSSSIDDIVLRRRVPGSTLALLPTPIMPNWYNKVCDAVSMLLDFHEGRVSAIKVLESHHPISNTDVDMARAVVRIKDAVALEIRFDRRTSLSDKHQLVFLGCKDRRKVCLSDLGDIDERSALYVPDLSKRSWLVKVGDQVVRAHDWQYGDEDGGAGSRGTVVAVVPWGGRNGCGVRVLWDATSTENTYRYGCDGFFDVQRFVSPRKGPDLPLIFDGDSVEFSIEADRGDFSKRLHLQGVDAFSGALHLQPGIHLQVDVGKHRRLLTDDSTFEMWIAPTAVPSSTTRLDVVSDTDLRHPVQSLGGPQGIAMTTIFRLLAADEVGGIDVLTDINGAVHVVPSPTAFDRGTIRSDNGGDSSCLQPGEWNHLAVVISSLRYTIFVNGVAVCEGDTNLETLRGVLASKLEVGPRDLPSAGFVSFHISDFKVWDVPLRADQLQAHANGLDTVNHSASSAGGFWGPSSQPSSPRTPRRLTVSNAFPPPSPARSPSRSLNTVSPHTKKWITANRAGRDTVHVRADCCIPVEGDPSANDVYFFEAHMLSGGKVCIGWVSMSSTFTHRDIVVGETAKSFGLELPQRKLHVAGKTIDTDVSSPRNGSMSPRRSSTSMSSFTSDVFAREGDVLGCAISMSKRKLWYFLNGELVIAITLEELIDSEQLHRQTDVPPGDEQREFDSLVGEMLSMGFSRTVSEDVVEASGASSVPGALSWLLDETSKSGEAPSPRRFSSVSPMSSPRRRFSSASEPSVRRIAVRDPLLEAVYPAASLGAQGAQGVAWNLGQRPFRFPPEMGSRKVVSVLEKTRRSEDSIKFEVFDHLRGHWEHISYRHRVQDIAPTLLAWWKLDEGEGITVHDAVSSQHGMIQGGSDDPSKLWDSECLVPLPVRKTRWTAVEPMAPPVATKKVTPAMWGYRCFVIPHFSASTIGRTRFGTSAPSLADGKSAIKSRQDQQFVKYINKSITSKQLSLPQALRASWNEISPSDDELLQWPVLIDIATGGTVDKTEEEGQRDNTPVSRMHGVTKGVSANEHLLKRFRILQDFNSAISRLLPFIPFDTPSIAHNSGVGASGDTGHITLSQLVTGQRFRIFNIVKRHVWDDALKRTTEAGVAFELSLNRVKAMRHRLAGKPDDEGRSALFSQAFRQLSALDGAHFRRSDAIYYVRFLGENAEDAGGPYRETFAQYSEELHSSQLSILLPSSNAHHNVGSGREKWVLNPGATSRTHIQMVEFLGKLMGVAARSRQYISLHIASLIWKKLVGEVATVDDLSLVDSMIVNSLMKIRDIDQFGVTEEMFEDIVMETFTTLSADNRVVPLKPNGESIAVTFTNRKEYVDLVEAYRLHEFDTQIAALLSGLAKVIPARLLSLFTGAELEILVCGSPEIDVDLLQRCTEYSSCSASDQHIIWFWEVLREFSHEERSAFLRFVWGRSRLPANEKEFPQLFKLQSFNKQQPGQPADAYLPIAHTCFFAVEMPIYSSIDVLRQKLLYAIYNCQEIDADGDSVAANQLGWEE